MRPEFITCKACGRTFATPARCRFPSIPVPQFCSRACANEGQRTRPEELESRLLAKRHVDPETGCWIWTGLRNPSGYGKIRVNGRHVRVPRLSAHIYLGFDLDSEQFICHRCDNPPCFNPDHLFPATPTANMADRDRKGRTARPDGEKHPMARLTEDDVREIRRLHATGLSHPEIAKRFSVSRPNISLIVAGKTWSHVA